MKDNLRFISFSLRGGVWILFGPIKQKEANFDNYGSVSTGGVEIVNTWNFHGGNWSTRGALYIDGHSYLRNTLITDHIPEQTRTQAETHWGLQQHLNILAIPATWVWRTMPTWRDLGRSCRRRGRGWRGWRKRWGRRFLSWKYILLGNNRWRREWGKRHNAKGQGGKVGDLPGFMSNLQG